MQSVAENISPAREALLGAALELFLQRGFAATRVEDIAARAGISKGAVYLHYANKEALFRGVVEAGVLASLEQAEQLAADFRGSATELLGTLLQNNLLEFWGSPSSGIAKLVIAESQQFPGLAESFNEVVTGRARQLLESILQLGIDQGVYRQVDIRYTARCILNALDHEVVLAHSLAPEFRQDFEPQRYVEVLLQLVVSGVSREPAA
jgi:AcrR family transcriptional regulator